MLQASKRREVTIHRGVSEVEGAPEPEVIINRIENAFAKLSYYLKAYDDDLRLVHNRNIQIIGFTHANSYDEIQADLVD